MALLLFPSSFQCDCGHQMHFSEGTVQGLGAMSERRRRIERLGDGGADGHLVEFEAGKARVIVCPELGRCSITGAV